MRYLNWSRVSALALLCCGLLFAQEEPAISGLVTRPGMPTEYYVNEVRITCEPGKTESLVMKDSRYATKSQDCLQHQIGESLTIFGAKNKKNGSVAAERVVAHLPVEEAVSGLALVDRILAPLKEGSLTLRADGYPLLITPKSKVTFAQASALKLENVGTNVWIQYAGTLRTDGTVAVASALFTPNTVSKTEDRVRGKTDFDAASVEESDRQGTVNKFLLGLNAKKIPAYKDAAMQARIERIGNKIIPAFERNLPSDDPTRVDFRFQLVDLKQIRDGLTLPSGIILVPYQVVEALPDDSQLACILATDVAEVMEKQAIRALPAARTMSASSLAGLAGSFFVPGLGLATDIVNTKAASVIIRHQQEQSGRTALAWMHDGGYDLTQAPLAWWKLQDKKNKGMSSVPMPYRTQYLYRLLATAWRTDPEVQNHK